MEVAGFSPIMAKSPQNLVQNFVKIFYSFGKGISRAAGHELGINLSKILEGWSRRAFFLSANAEK